MGGVAETKPETATAVFRLLAGGVVGAGVESLTGRQAAILVFVNQTTTSQDKPSPTTASSSVRVGLAKVNGTWLINRFDPL
jgi:hypothetical protein